jgi:hypothetical protein
MGLPDAGVHCIQTSVVHKGYRRVAGFIQEVLAERAGPSIEAIGALERAVNRSPQRETLHLLAQALHLCPQEQALFKAAACGCISRGYGSSCGG